MRNICIVTSNISACGGMEKMAILLANQLNEYGYKVTILSIYENKNDYFHMDSDINVRALYLLASKVKIFKIFSRNIKRRQKSFFRFVKKLKPDIIINLDIPLVDVTCLASKQFNIPCISWDHFNNNFYNDSKARKNSLKLNKELNNDIVVLSKADKKAYIERFNYNKDKVHQIYNPTSIERYAYTEHADSKTVIAVGRYNWEKGFDLLLNAWKKVEDNNDDWHLEIWGQKSNWWDYTNKELVKLNLKRVHLHEETTNIEELYDRAEILAMPSRHEGQSLVLVEAFTCGLPVVSFDCPSGPRELIEDGNNGFLVEPENTEQMADKLLDLINDKDLRVKFGKRSFEISKKFDSDVFIERWLEIIEAL